MPSDHDTEEMPEFLVDSIDILLLDAFESDMEAKLVKNLRAKDLLVAEHVLPVSEDEDETALLAYIGYSEVSVDGGDDLIILGLGPMAVASNAQGNGVGLDFLKFSIEALGEEGVNAIILLGHTAFYGKAGFKPAADYGLKFNDDPATAAAFMALELTEGCLAGCSGKVTYASDFY